MAACIEVFSSSSKLRSYQDLVSSLHEFVNMQSKSNGIGSFQSFIRNCLQDYYVLLADSMPLTENEQLNMLYPLKKPLTALCEISNQLVAHDKKWRQERIEQVSNDVFVKNDVKQATLKIMNLSQLLLPNDILLRIIVNLANANIDTILFHHLLNHICIPILSDLKNFIKFGSLNLPLFAMEWLQSKLQFICSHSYDDDWHSYVDCHFKIDSSLFASYLCNDKQAKYEIESCVNEIYLRANHVLIKKVKAQQLMEWLEAKRYYFLLLPSDATEYFIQIAYEELCLEEDMASTSRLQVLYESCHRLVVCYPTIKKRSKTRGYMIEQTNATPNKSSIQSSAMKNRLTSHSLLDLLRLDFPANNLLNLITDNSIEQCYRNLFELQWLLRVCLFELRKCKATDKALMFHLSYVKHVISTITLYTGEILDNHWNLMYKDIYSSLELKDIKEIHQNSMIRMCQDCFLPVDDVVIILDLMRSTRLFALLLQREQPVDQTLYKWGELLRAFKTWIKAQSERNDSEWSLRANSLLLRLDFNDFFK